MQKTIIPLLKDNHTHTFSYASLYKCLDLRNVIRKEKALKYIKERKEPFIVVLGWYDSRYEFSRKELDQFPPLIICNASLHYYLMNSPALDILKDKHGDVVSNINDKIWVEKNVTKLLSLVAGLRPFEERNFDEFFKYLETQGVWYAEDMYVSEPRVIDYFITGPYKDRSAIWTDISTYKSLSAERKKAVTGIKLFTDGAIGSKMAAIKMPYVTGGNGLLFYKDEDLYNAIAEVSELSLPLAIHTVGNRAIEQTLNIISLLGKDGLHPHGRLEHCIFISKESALLAKDLGITLSMQPNFNTDSVDYKGRLHEKYCRRIDPFRMLIDEVGFLPGKDLIFGSDGMPHGVQFALEQSLFPLYKSQRLTLDEIVAGYCMTDYKNGYIEIDIDKEKNKVLSKVVAGDCVM